MSRNTYDIQLSQELYERLVELKEKFEFDDMENLIEYILDKSTFLEYE